jgi:enoyl-CoA hydratase/carnithine racemase
MVAAKKQNTETFGMYAQPIFTKSFQGLTITRDEFIVEVAINRPDARNALSPTLMAELIEVARALRLTPEIRAVILRGGPEFFSAGADLGNFKDRMASDAGLMALRKAVMSGPDLCRAWEEIEAVTIAAIEGFCIGGGCALAVACDFRIMAEGSYMRLPEVPLGINMSWRSIPRITSLIGPARAKRFIIFGQKADAATCLDWGFADELAPKGEAHLIARAWAERLADLPPLPVRMTKEAVNMAAGANHLATSFMDRDQYLLASRSEDFREGVSAFLEKRKPVFKGN